MVTIKKKQFAITITEHWFDYKPAMSDLFLPVAYRSLRASDKTFRFGKKKLTKSAVLFLDKTVEQIHADFFTSVKRDIKKATAEGVTCVMNNDAATFIKFYNEFAKSKGVAPLYRERTNEFNKKEWKCSYAILNGEILAAHSYFEDRETGIVRSMQSGSLRFDEQINPRQIAQANKLLHYFDIQYFKEQGLREYDFGGWDGIPGLLEFKQSFGANPIDTFNYFTYLYLLKEELQQLPAAFRKSIPHLPLKKMEKPKPANLVS